MKKAFQYIGIGFVGFMAIGFVFTLCDRSDKTKVSTVKVDPDSMAVEIPEEASIPDVEILKFNETMDKYTGMRTIHVKIKNNSGNLIQYIDLKGIYYDKNDNIVGTGLGNAANIGAGKTKTIDILAMGIEDTKRYEIELGNVIYQ